MDMHRAIEVLGINRQQYELRNMVRALGLMSYLNTSADNERRTAASYVLKRWQAYQRTCNGIRDTIYSMRGRK